MEALLTVANLLYLFSYSLTNLLYLRLISIIAALCLVVYFYHQPFDSTSILFWNTFFVLLNGYQIVRILGQRNKARRRKPTLSRFA